MDEYDDDYGDDYSDEWLYIEDYYDEAVRGFYSDPNIRDNIIAPADLYYRINSRRPPVLRRRTTKKAYIRTKTMCTTTGRI